MKQLTHSVFLAGPRYFNYFIVGHKDVTIIECGVTGAIAGLKPTWMDIKSKSHVRQLVVMHAHFDHVCGVPALLKIFPEAEVLASKQAQKILSKSKILKNFFHQDRAMSKILTNEGFISKIPESPQVRKITVDRIIENGMTIDLSQGLSIKVIETPGHSPCGIACYLPEEKIMMMSDACGFQISDSEIFPLFFQSYDLYIRTIKKLMEYPTCVIADAHGKIWMNDEVDLFYKRALDSAETAYNKIRIMLEANKDDALIEQQIFRQCYHGNLKIYTSENIQLCVKLLIKRVKECLEK